MKFLYSSPSEPEVGLLKSLLDEAGIACEIRNESTHPNLPGAAFQPELWVARDDDYARASRICDDWRTPSPAATQGLSAGLRIYGGLLLLFAAAVFGWQCARLAAWGGLVGALTLFGLIGIVLLLSGAADLKRRRRR
jgi:hypothetical protein